MSACDFTPHAEVAILNGTVVTADAKNTIAEAVAVRNGKIVKVGSSKEIKKLIGKNTVVIDLEGKTVLPGLIDVHVHIAEHALQELMAVDCRDFHNKRCSSIPRLLARIKEIVMKKSPGEWIEVVLSPGQEERFLEKRFPKKSELDLAAPKNPVVVNFGENIVVANTLALDIAKISKDSIDPKGGRIERDSLGEPTGVLYGAARHIVRRFIPYASRSRDALGERDTFDFFMRRKLKEGIYSALCKCLRRGVTTVHDVVTRAEEIQAYQELLFEKKLPVRVHLLLRIVESGIKPESVLNLGLTTSFGNDWLKIGGIKLSIDSEDGTLIRVSQNELNNIIRQFNSFKMRCVVHACSQNALNMAIEAYELALTEHSRDDHRHRLEHVGNYEVNTEQLNKIKKLGILPVPNISFLYYGKKGEFLVRTFLSMNFLLTSGSDGPYLYPIDPLRDISTCITRKTKEGKYIAINESISMLDAIKMFTINAAYAGFEEQIKGSIEVGKMADLIVLSSNLFEIPPEKIKDAKVQYVLVDGKLSYQSKSNIYQN